MVKVEVYGDARATCTQRVMILLEELDLKYTVIPVDLTKGEHKSEEFRKLQPFGKVPAVKYDERVLFESRSILRYIAKNNSDIKDLLGGTDVDIWLEAESQNYNPPASRIVAEKVFKRWRGERPDMDVIKTSVEELERVLDVYETRLSSVPYIGGEHFSIADISHIPYTNYLLKCGYKNLFKERPNVYRWLKRIVKRDSVQYLVDRDGIEDDDGVDVNKEEMKEQKQENYQENEQTPTKQSERAETGKGKTNVEKEKLSKDLKDVDKKQRRMKEKA